MNDLERRLKNVLETDAARAPRVPQPPSDLRKRVRRRQAGTVLVSIVAVVGVVGASITGLRAIGGEDRADVVVDDPWAGYEIFERTASLGFLSITGPSDWYLLNPAQDARCVAALTCTSAEILQLSSFDPGLDRSACQAPVPEGGVVLTVSVGREAPEGLPEHPVTFDQAMPMSDGPCGPGRYAAFQLGAWPAIAWLGTGEGAPDDDVEEAIRAFDGLRALDPREELPDGDAAASYVIAGGENAAGPWRLEARPSSPDVNPSNVELELISPEGGSVVTGFDVPSLVIQQAGGDPTFGAVTKEAVTVELRSDEVVEPTWIVPVPPSIGADFDLFFGSHEGDVQADAVPLDGSGEPIGTPYVVPTVRRTSDGMQVLQRFEAFGNLWELAVPQTGDGCSLRRVGDASGGGSCELSVMASRTYAFVYGTAPVEVSTAHVVTADGRELPCVVLTAGPSGRRYFVVPLEGEGPGVLRMLRDDGSVVRSISIDWREELVIGPPVDGSQ